MINSSDPQPVTFNYLNHNGKHATRRVLPEALEFHSRPGFGYQPGWFLSGWDLDKNARRSFALSRIELPEDFLESSSPHRFVFTLLNL